MSGSPIDRLIEIIARDLDEDHRPLLRQVDDGAGHRLLVERIRQFLRLTPDAADHACVHLLQERAILLLGDVLWNMLRLAPPADTAWIDETLLDVSPTERIRDDIRRVLEVQRAGSAGEADSAYLEYINQFLAAANEREMMDFRLAKEALLRATPRTRAGDAAVKSVDASYHAMTPMRVGISSANASDNWTFSKLRGGVVVNFAVDLATAEGAKPRPPIEVSLGPASDPVVELLTVSQLDTDRQTHVVIRDDNALEFLAIPPGQPASVERCFKDIRDPLLLLKYALVFAGIVGFKEAPGAYVERPARLLEDVKRFMQGRGLRLTVRSAGPSRSGFASSSCVALGLLRVLYGASRRDDLAAPRMLSSLALLLENEVGLKSGKQDTDGPLYPGLKSIRYVPTTGFLEGEIERLDVDEGALCERLFLVNSGIQRPAATGLRRGLNMRHYSYISRDPKRFPAVMRSLAVHDEIVGALARSDWRRLGDLFDEYLDLRETIDPGATQSVYDEQAHLKMLRLPFERLKREGLIFGGMYTGAMGGGCMMLVATPRGRERVQAGRREPRLVEALRSLAELRVGADRPFKGLEIYDYAVSNRGLEYEETPAAS